MIGDIFFLGSRVCVQGHWPAVDSNICLYYALVDVIHSQCINILILMRTFM